MKPEVVWVNSTDVLSVWLPGDPCWRWLGGESLVMGKQCILTGLETYTGLATPHTQCFSQPGNAVCCEPGDGRTPGRLSYLEDPQLVQGHLSHPLGCWKFVECWIVPCLASFSLCSDPELWAGALPSCPPQALPVEAFLRPGLMHLHWEEVEASLRPPQLSGGAPAIGRCCSEWAGCGSSVCGLARCCSGITRGRLGFSPECGGASCAQRDF